MFYKNELDFLCDTLHKRYVRACAISPFEPIGSVIDTGLHDIMNHTIDPDESVHKYIGALEPHTMYKATNEFKLCYVYFLLPSPPEQTSIFFMGPYMSAPLSSRELLELGERIGISPKSQRYLEEYYSSIPVISDKDGLLTMVDTFCEHIWGSASFAIVDVNNQHRLPDSPISEITRGESFDDIIVNMKAMEKRYEFENEIIRAVSLGQMHKETLFSGTFSEHAFEKRVNDPVRNAKNYCIIMNTLLRKAAEQGGVHPLYLDRVSSEFATKIEQFSSLPECSALMKDMFRSYCRLVRKHSMQKFSPAVQKTILIIDSDLSADLSLSLLAESQGISPGYLSTVFKKETGKTVSEYIRDKRIKYATHLLGTTHLQIQTVALHCGIMDVQYFSKIFKKETGKTLTEYVNSRRIEYAKKLLKTTNLQIQTVAGHCGIMDVQYFTKLFKRYEGKTPKEFRTSL